VLVASQDAHHVEVFKVDATSGALTPTGSKIEVPRPICVKMIPVAVAPTP